MPMIDIDRPLPDETTASVVAEAWRERTAPLDFLLPADKAAYDSLFDEYARWLLTKDDIIEEMRYYVLRAATLLVAFVTAPEHCDVAAMAQPYTTCTAATDITSMILYRLHGDRGFWITGGHGSIRVIFAVQIGIAADRLFKDLVDRADWLAHG